MPQRQVGNPLVVENGVARPLERLAFDDRTFDENRLQALLFQHPELLPAAELEPVFEDLIPVCRELPTPSGPLDLLYVTPGGNLCLVETKLWRNPEARRSVVAQLIDYTENIAGWSYTQLVEAIRKAPPGLQGDPVSEEEQLSPDLLLTRVTTEQGDVDERDFIDAVSRSLRLGRFLLLIVGDGIREDVERMANFLQRAPQLSFTLGLVEIGMYRWDDGPGESLLIQPRVVARTKEVTRAVVEIHDRSSAEVGVQVKLPPEPRPGGGGSPPSITEDEFFEQLGKYAPAAVDVAKYLVEHAGEIGVTLDWSPGGCIFASSDTTTISPDARSHPVSCAAAG